jgi:hypothetical protein
VSWDGQTKHCSSSSSNDGIEVTADYSVGEIPIYVRAGAVVPMRTYASLAQTTAFSDPLVWVLWPTVTAGGGAATVVEDDGATLRFESGATATTTMKWSHGSSESGSNSNSNSSYSNSSNSSNSSNISGGGDGGGGGGDGGAQTPGSSIIVLEVAATQGNFSVECSGEQGFEYGGPGADLQDVGVVGSADACCDSCATFSNCAFWTLDTVTNRCMLKVSRAGRRANRTAVSGQAPRRMPATRAHGFQLRSAITIPPTSVTAGGVPLPKVAPGSDKVGWFVQPSSGGAEFDSLTVAPNALVVLTDTVPLTQSLTVVVTY